MNKQKASLPPNHYQSTLNEKIKSLETCISEATEFEGYATNFLANIEADADIQNFYREYQKVLKVIKKSKNSCVGLKIKASALESEFVSQEHTHIDANKIQSDSETLKLLKNQINRAEIMLLASSKREEQVWIKCLSLDLTFQYLV